jgi:hypothetical protein
MSARSAVAAFRPQPSRVSVEPVIERLAPPARAPEVGHLASEQSEIERIAKVNADRNECDRRARR